MRACRKVGEVGTKPTRASGKIDAVKPLLEHPDPIRRVAGIDFTSRPTRTKPVTVALGRLDGAMVTLERVEAHADYESFSDWLRTAGPWVAAFDFPFGLPRELVEALGWPSTGGR